MNHKLLTFKDRKTGKRSCFSPMLVSSIVEIQNEEGRIVVQTLGGNSETEVWIDYDYQEAVKRWQEAINT